MATRKSKRLATKSGPNRDEGEELTKGSDEKHGRRASVGDALGLTPAKQTAPNLEQAKAASAAEAAAARLDELNASTRTVGSRKKRKSGRSRKAAAKKRDRMDRGIGAEKTYEATSRESIALFAQTEAAFENDGDEGKADGEGDQSGGDMPPLIDLSNGESVSEDESSESEDEEMERVDGSVSSVIATPCRRGSRR